jgi:hypothetical protein
MSVGLPHEAALRESLAEASPETCARFAVVCAERHGLDHLASAEDLFRRELERLWALVTRDDRTQAESPEWSIEDQDVIEEALGQLVHVVVPSEGDTSGCVSCMG